MKASKKYKEFREKSKGKKDGTPYYTGYAKPYLNLPKKQKQPKTNDCE